MAVTGITFSQQICTSKDDAHFHNCFLSGQNGITKGCEVTSDGEKVYIQPGYFVVCGRYLKVVSAETVTPEEVTTGTKYARLVFEVDLTKENSDTEFNQGYFKILTNTSSYPTVTQEDLDGDGNVYQMPFAKFEINTTGIANFVVEVETLSFPNDYVSKNGGQMLGALVANRNENYSVAQVRNMYITTTEPSTVPQGLGNGDIILVVEAPTT